MPDNDPDRPPSSWFGELKRRNVLRVAVFYVLVSWVALQAADILSPALHLPEWTVTFVLVVLLLGLPVVLVLAWVFELTPEGIRRESDVARARSITHVTGRRLDFLIIGVLAVAVAILLYDKLAPAGPPALAGSDRTIAVLPFKNLSGDRESEIFSDGLAETLMHMLTQIDSLHVAASTSSFQFKDHAGDIAQVAAALRVRNLLEGSVTRSGEQWRITAQLVDAQTGFRLWAGKFNGPLSDIFAVQDDIAAHVAGALRVEILGEPAGTLRAGDTASVAAYQAYLEARRQQQEGSFESLPRALALYERALQIDPVYALAALGLAETCLDMWDTGVMGLEEAAGRVNAMLERARAVLGEGAPVLALRGRLRVSQGDYDAARADFLTALDDDPDSLVTLNGYARLLQRQGRSREAIQYLRRALDFDPRSPALLGMYGRALVQDGRTDEALAQYAEQRRVAPANPAGYYLAGFALAETGRFVEAVDFFLQASEIDPADHEIVTEIGSILLDLGDADAARAWIEKSDSISPQSHSAQAARMNLFAVTGEHAAAVEIARGVLEAGADVRKGGRWLALWWLFNDGMRHGNFDEFLTWMRRLYPEFFQTPPDLNASNAGYADFLMRAYRATGDSARSEALATLLLQHYRESSGFERNSDPLDQAITLAALGRHDEAVAALRVRLDRNGLRALWSLEIEPGLEAFRATDDYRRLMAEANAELARQREQIRERFGI